eukprot:GHVT01098224.1.p1 GENE.GHVT01098224.1~~GHVT01098224.1.p1  ORF type:complete len:398 (+),score=63.28 GHVT01098224.1:2319-3512(+)
MIEVLLLILFLLLNRTVSFSRPSCFALYLFGPWYQSGICKILHEERLVEQSRAVRLVCIDRPVAGPFRQLRGVGGEKGRGGGAKGRESRRGAGGEGGKVVPGPNAHGGFSLTAKEATSKLSLWLRPASGGHPTTATKQVAGEISNILNTFKTSFLLVPGLESAAAFRLQEIISDITNRVGRVRAAPPRSPAEWAELQQVVECCVYLSTFRLVWRHLRLVMKEKQILFDAHAQRFREGGRHLMLRGLQIDSELADVSLESATALLRELIHCRSPTEKLDVIVSVVRSVHDSCAAAHQQQRVDGDEWLDDVEDVPLFGQDSQLQLGLTPQISLGGDELVGLVSWVVASSEIPFLLSHVAHVDMFLATKPREERLQSCSYFFTTFHSAASFLLQTEPTDN